jgi:antitoxin VapB
MALNIKNERVEQLAQELAHITGESKTAAILHALEERRERIVTIRQAPGERMAQALNFLENEIWPNIPRKLLGRRVTKKERERILGYGRGGV